MIAGWQHDAMICFTLFHKSLGGPCDENFQFISEAFEYPSNLPDDGRIRISQMLHQIAMDKGVILDGSHKTLVLCILPYRTQDETDKDVVEARWVDLTIAEWDATVDLSPLIRGHPSCSEYHVKAAVYHLHAAEALVSMMCGHYVTYVKQAQQWHLADDDVVSPVLMSRLHGLPYVVALERKDAPGSDLFAAQVQQPAEEISVGHTSIPSEVRSDQEAALGETFARVSEGGRDEISAFAIGSA